MIEELFRGKPAIFAALGLALGIGCWPMLVRMIDHPFGIMLWLIGAAVVLYVALCWRKETIKIVVLFAAFVTFGASRTAVETASLQHTPLANIASLKPAKILLTGSIDEIDEKQNEYDWIFETDSFAIPDSDGHFSTTYAAKGAVLLRLTKFGDTSVPLPKEGSRLSVYSALEPFHAPTNPHEYAIDLKLQSATHTEAVGVVHSRFDYAILSIETPSIGFHIAQAFQSVHRVLLTLLDTALHDNGWQSHSSDARGFVEAVVLGDRSDMDKETLNDFTIAGVAHILAVSGFNVAIIALVVAQLLRIVGIYRLRVRLVLTMLMVFIYCGIVGFQPSVVRALAMIELYLLAQLMERKPQPLNIVMSAAAINLLLRPQDLFDAGFQLSYAGVLGMVLIAPKLRWLLGLAEEDSLSLWKNNRFLRRKWVREIVNAFALSVGASIASYPVIAVHFYRISFIGLLANLPLVPLSAIITAYGFLLLPLTAISHSLGQVYGSVTSYMTDLLLVLTHLSARVPSAAHAAASPSWIFLTLLFLSTFFVLGTKTRKQFAARVSIALAGFFMLWSFHVPFADSLLAKNDGTVQALVFDVGQGDCILFRTPSGKCYFIDFGRIEQNGNANIERTAIPFLRAEYITELDGGFISHMHSDHYGGASALLRSTRVASLMTSGERVPDRTARALDSIAASQCILLRILSRGDTIHLDSEVTLYVLHPNLLDAKYERTAYGKNIHGGMLVFKIVYRNTSFLFLGDLERDEEEAMLAQYGSFLQATVVKVAHHGSPTSSSEAFVHATQSQYAIVSVGEHNHFGHPSPFVIKRWRESGAHVCRTDADGAILLVSDGATVHREYWQ